MKHGLWDMTFQCKAESPAPSNTYPLDDIKFVNVPVIGSVAAGTVCLADNEIIWYEPTDYDDVKTDKSTDI